MATSLKNLSHYDPSALPDGSSFYIGIAVAEWNPEVTNALLEGAVATLLRAGVKEERIEIRRVPGTFELPIACQWMAEQKKTDAVIGLGCVIQGETRHFDFICDATANAMQNVALKSNKPCIFGVLTTDNQQQALDRAGGKHGNKGDEAAVTALKMVALRP
ncbi:MAG: 6,7-dimethyl-8-ribityllumazine synthase [Bacteroidia bacterium]